MCSVAGADGDDVMTSYEEWAAVADDEDHIRTIATADLMEFYANEIVQELAAHRPYADLPGASDSDSEAAAFTGLETILEETSDDMRSDTDSLRSASGVAAWTWPQDSGAGHTAVNGDSAPQNGFEDDFNPMEIDSAMASAGKLTSPSRGSHNNGAYPADMRYRQLFDFEAFLRSGGSQPGRLGIGPPSPSLLPSLDPTFNTSATQFPFSDSAQTEPEPITQLPGCAADQLVRPSSCCPHADEAAAATLVCPDGWEPARRALTAPAARENTPAGAPTALGTCYNGRASPEDRALRTSSHRLGATVKVLGMGCNGRRPAADASSGCSAVESTGRRVCSVDLRTSTGAAHGGQSKWDLGSCEDFENLNRRIESLTYDFEEEERRSLEFIIDNVATFEQLLKSAGRGEDDWRRVEAQLGGEIADGDGEAGLRAAVRRFQSVGDLSMIAEAAPREACSEQSGDIGAETGDRAGGDVAASRPLCRRRPALLGLLRHSSENLSEDSGYGERVSPQEPPAERSCNLPRPESPAAALRHGHGSFPFASPLGRLSKSTSDLSPRSHRRRRLLELISRDEERRARLYADARPSDARHPPPQAPPPVAGDATATEGSAETGRQGTSQTGQSVRGDRTDSEADSDQTEGEVESVLVLLDDEESNSVIQVVRQKMAGPVPAPRASPRAPAVYQNLPSNSRAVQLIKGPAEPAAAAHRQPDTRVKRDIEQFERIKEAFLEKGMYNVHDDMTNWRSPQKGVPRTRSTPDLSLDPLSDDDATIWAENLRQTARRCFDKFTTQLSGSQQPNDQHICRAGRPADTKHGTGSDSQARETRGRCSGGSDAEPRDIYLSDGETQVLTMYRSSAGRPKPLDLRLAEEFLLLEGIEGDDLSTEPYERGSLGRCGSHADQLALVGGAAAGVWGRQRPDWRADRATEAAAADGSGARPRRSHSLWNLSGVDGAPTPHSDTCALSQSVQELWSEENRDSPRRLHYYRQTMEWPGSGDYRPLEAARRRSPSPPPQLNLDLNGAPRFHKSAELCAGWPPTIDEADSAGQRSLSGHFFFGPGTSSVPQLNGSVESQPVRIMSVNNSFTSRVPLKTYGRQNEVEVYISKESDAVPAQQVSPASVCSDDSAVVRRDKPRGVQFSPVVSEVQWRESYLESEPSGGERRSLQSFQQPERAERQPTLAADMDRAPPPPAAQPAAQPAASGEWRNAEPVRRRAAPPQPPPRLTRPSAPAVAPAAAAPALTADAHQTPPPPSVQSVVSKNSTAPSVAAQPRAVPPPVVPAPTAAYPQPAASSQTACASGEMKMSTPTRVHQNGSEAAPVTARLHDEKKNRLFSLGLGAKNQAEKPTKTENSLERKTEAGDKPEKPAKQSMLVRLGLGRLSGRSKPKPPPKPEGIKPTSSRSPSPRSPAHESPRISPSASEPPRSTASPATLPPSPVAGPPSPPQPLSQTQRTSGCPEPFGATATTSTPLSHPAAVAQRAPSPAASRQQFPAPPSPAIRVKSFSLPRSADIPLLTASVSPVASVCPPVPPAELSTSAAAAASSAKPPLPPLAQRSRLSSARRNFFLLEQQRVIPLRSVPAPPMPDSPPHPRTARSAAADIKDAFERFRQRAREDRERLAKSTPDLSLIETSTRSLVRPRPPPAPAPAPAARPSIDRDCGGPDGGGTPQWSCAESASGTAGDAGARALRGYSRSRDRFAQKRAAALARARSRSVGVLETDLDAPEPGPETDLDAVGRGLQQCIAELSPPKEKAKSLLHLEQEEGMAAALAQGGADGRAKSMEFLLSEDNKTSAQPPENELMRGERRVSEHELRFQRSLRNLNTPDWYKKSGKADSGLRRDYGSGSLAGGWSGLNSKSNSKESLQSSRCTTPTTPAKVVIPSRVRAPGWRYVRGTSRESLTSPGSGAPSPAPSDRSALYYGGGMYRAGSSRHSQASSGAQSPVSSSGGGPLGGAGGRGPQRPTYLGWRSQERLNQGYQTPADRLASSICRNRSEGNLAGAGARLSLPRPASSGSGVAEPPARPQQPDMDVHSSIKEVTSAIVHYFDSAAGSDGASMGGGSGERGSPRPRLRGSRAGSPSRRPVWLETAFVGTKPTDEPPTPEAAGTVLSEPLCGREQPAAAAICGELPRPHPAPATSAAGTVTGPGPSEQRRQLGELVVAL